MFHILIVEDDEEIREELRVLLENSGYKVSAILVFDEVAQQILELNSHLVLLDVNLPGKNGYEICRKVRTKSKVPIIFVTSRNQAMEELNGLMLGADDYIEKPYDVPILLARIQNLLNRVYPKEEKESKITYRNVTLDILKSAILRDEKEMDLTKTELKTLYYLFKNQNQIVPREKSIDYLWDNGVYADDNSLSVIITRLREKLKDVGVENLIETKRGQGYKI